MNTDSLASQRQPGPWKIALTLAMLLAAYLLLASSSSLWDRDEPRFARCTVEMVESGDYLVPRYNGELRPDKPAGIYWLMSLGYRALGLTEVAFRLPSILGILSTAFLTYLIGKRLFNTRVGYWAMVFYGGGLMAAYMATASTADGAMNGFITLAIWSFVELAHGRRRMPMLLVMAFALAAAQLIKGPVGMVIPVLSMATMGLLGARGGAFKLPRLTWLGIGAAALLSFGAFAAWGIPANIASGGELLRQGLGKHVVERATSPMENHGGASVLAYLAWLPFYIPVIIAAFTPWTMLLPGGVCALIQGNLGEARQRAVLWGWIAPTFIMMTLVVTRLPHYILPIFPGLAILCAAVIDPIHASRLNDRDHRWMRAGRFFVAPIFVAIGGGAVAAPWLIPQGQDPVFLIGCTAVGLVILGFGGFQVWQIRQQRTDRAIIAAAFSLPITLAIACLGILPTLEDTAKPARPLARAVQQAGLPNDAPVIFCGIGEPSFAFYLNRSVDKPITFTGNPEQIAQWTKQPGPGLLVVANDYFEHIRDQVGPVDHLQVIFESGVVQYSDQGKSGHITALLRK